ncbi:MAG: VWA domain-containing protein [Terracidiphilus sp.]|jgi:VWFA-related protein
MRLRISSRFVPVMVFSCCVAPLAAQADSAPGGQRPDYTFKTNTNAVVVDVVVTKGSGEPVPALRKQDFRVLEDGKPQTIDFFEEHAARTQLAGSLPDLPKMPPNVYTNVPPAPADDAVNVLLLDSLNTPPQMISYARNEILNYLNHVKPGTRIAIITMNDSLEFVQGFTTDASRLREVALKQTTPGISPALVTKSEVGAEQEFEAFISSNGPAAPGGTGVSGSVTATSEVANAFVNHQNYMSDNRTRMTAEAISDIARYLAAVPGRKNLIWFAGDFPIVIFPKFDQRMEFEDNLVALSQVQKTADLLTAARVAVYPVYANGMMTDDIVSADNRGVGSAASIGHMASISNMDVYTAGNDDRASEIAAMNQIAQDTGGKAIYNTNDLDTAIGRSVADGAHYYTLVYSPTNKKMDGHYRKIEVKLADSKLKLSYRHGYNADEDSALAPDPKKDTDPLRQQLVHGMPDATQILFAVRAVPATPQPAPGGKIAGKNASLSGPTTRYAIDFMIRWTDVALAAMANGMHQGKIDVGLIAWDGKGKSVNWDEGTQPMTLKPDIYASIQKSGIPAHMEIDLPNTDLYLKLGLLDEATGKAGTLEIPLHFVPTTATATAPQTAPKTH